MEAVPSVPSVLQLQRRSRKEAETTRAVCPPGGTARSASREGWCGPLPAPSLQTGPTVARFLLSHQQKLSSDLGSRIPASPCFSGLRTTVILFRNLPTMFLSLVVSPDHTFEKSPVVVFSGLLPGCFPVLTPSSHPCTTATQFSLRNQFFWFPILITTQPYRYTRVPINYLLKLWQHT